ncbi:MAG: hypothetical protein KDA05_12860 [Phycisphaerales bacterium]|nr:hypothetical protein [Phycisphaerales bacterium]
MTTVEFKVHLAKSSRGAIEVRSGAEPVAAAKPTPPTGRVPRVSKLMALALRIEDLVRTGQVADYADVARLAHVTRARIAQISGLACLAPDIIDEVLHLPLVTDGRDPLTERDLRPLAVEPDWAVQRPMWRRLAVDRMGAG